MWCRRFCVAVVAVLGGVMLGITPAQLSAQIRIVPQNRLDSIAKPTTVGEGKIRIVEGAEREFGLLQEGEKWSTRIEWQNISSEPLVVTRVTTGCSCVKAEYSRSTVTPQQTGSVQVTFNSQGRVGGVVQRVYIYTNLSERTPSAIVTIRGRVKSSPENEAYPEAMGDLRLGSRRAVFAKAEGGKVGIPVRNAGTRALRITTDAMFPTDGVELRLEPEVLEAGAEGVLIVECESGVTTSRKVYVGGVEVAPRNRTIDIVVE